MLSWSPTRSLPTFFLLRPDWKEIWKRLNEKEKAEKAKKRKKSPLGPIGVNQLEKNRLGS